MTPERWREIERVYHAALEHPAEERGAFLEAACEDDEALRREVESLLEYQPRAEAFIERPAGGGRLASAVRRFEAPIPGRFVGRVLGAYEVQALIAAGGMGEVYRALDPRLHRTVAIKTLPERVPDDPQRVERFKREARIVSSLNHPHICTLHDIGTEDDVHYLVMEHIEGETLEQRLVRGRLPLADAINFSIQIVDALDRAHRLGVVHRDLKPGNVMVTKSGVKVLDFGLAAQSTSPPGDARGEDTNQTRSSTLTADGAIVGTLQYMSPEQLEGRSADARSDIFAFGALAYEMVTGIRAFRAETRAGLIGAILEGDPRPIVEVAPDLPVPLAQTLSRCLAKDPDERWQTANDLLFQLRAIAASPATAGILESRAGRVPRWGERALWAAAVIAAVAGTWLSTRSTAAPPAAASHGMPAIRYTLSPPDGTAFFSGYDLPFALSPDGRHLVYVGVGAAAAKQLWVRSLSSAHEQPIAGTAGASSPFWSPDSQWIGFFADNSLKKVRVATGLVQTVAGNVTTYGGATWNAGDVILFPGARPGGLSRVSARGGPVVPATTPTEGSHFWPQFLGDGEHFVYAATIRGALYLGSLRNAPPRELMTFPVRISSVAYVPGYILFVQDSTLFARPFDEARLEFSGEPIRVVDGIPVIGFGRAPFAVSAAGVLAYWPYAVGTPAILQWFDRTGRPSAAVDTPAQYIGFAVSPDARQVALSRTGKDGGADLWLRDLDRGTERQLTYDGAAFTPQWSPDTARVAFSGPGDKPPPKLFVKSIADRTPAVQLTPPATSTPDLASGWSGNGRAIVSVRLGPATGDDLWVHDMDRGVSEPLPFNTRFNESLGKVSPDNQWITFVTDESGREEVWVASFPGGQIRRQVSNAGGTSPQWGEGSTEIVYVAPKQQLMSAVFHGGEKDAVVGTPRALFRIENLAEDDRSLFFATRNDYVAASNGQRFLAAVRARDPNAPPMTIVINWPALLNQR